MTQGGDEEGGLATIGSSAVRVFGGRVGKLAIGLLNQIVMARLLGTAGYGSVVIAQLAIGLVSLVATFGIQNGLVRYVPYHDDDPAKLRGVVRAGLGVGLLTGGAAGVALFASAPWIATRVFGDESLTLLLRIAALAVPFGVISHVAAAVAKGAGSTAVRVVVRQTMNPLLRLVLVTTLILAGYGALGATVSVAATLVVGSVVSLYFALRALPVSLRGAAVPMRRSLLAYSAPLMITSSIEFLVGNTDTVLVGYFIGPAAVGVYDIAFQLRQFGMYFFYPVTFLLPTVVARFDREGNQDAIRRTYQVTTKWLVLVSTPLILLVLAFPAVVIRLTFGGDYVPGAPALRVLMVAVMVTVLLSANGTALVALGHNRVNAAVNAGAVLLNLALNVVLIPRLGIVGAAAASATAFVARDVVYTLALYRLEGVQPFSAALLRPYVASLALAGGGYVAFVRLVEPGPLTVALGGLAYLAVYAPTLVVLGAIEPEDERLIDRLEGRVDVDLSRLRTGLRRLRRVG